MTISVKFFSSLRESLGLSAETVNYNDANTVSEVWDKVTNGTEMPKNVLIAINMDYVDRSHKVHDGDEIAFFPPVTGG